MALASIIPGLLAEGHEVWGADEHFDSEEAMVALAREQKIDWVGATVLEHNADRVGAIFAQIRRVSEAKFLLQECGPRFILPRRCGARWPMSR